MLIRKDDTTLNVTKGAFSALFEAKGWRKVKEGKENRKAAQSSNFMAPQPTKKQTEQTEQEEMPFGALFQCSEKTALDDGDYEVVLEDMTIKQLKAYAIENGIDLEEATSKKDIIGMIRAEMEE